MNTKTTLLLAVICAVVAAYFFFIEKPWAPPVEPAKPKTADKNLFETKPEGTDKVEVSRRDGTKMTFTKDTQGEWSLVVPLKAPAKKYEVDSLVDMVTGLVYVEEYKKGGADAPSTTVSGLDKPAVGIRLFKGDKTLADVLIGSRKPMGTGYYLQLAGEDNIRVSKNDLSYNINKKLDDYRDKRVLNFPMDKVQRVKVEGLQNFEMVRDNQGDWVMESPLRGRADKTAAENMVRPLSSLQADAFKEDSPLSYKPYLLATMLAGGDESRQIVGTARLKISVEAKYDIPPKAKPGDPNTKPADTQPSTENRTHVLLVGGPIDTNNDSFFARIDSPETPWVFSIKKQTLESIAPDPTSLRDKTIASIDTDKVAKIQLSTPSGSMELTRNEQNKWFFTPENIGALSTEADSTLVGDLLKAVRDLKASQFVDPAKSLVEIDWKKPRAKVTFTLKGELNPVTILVGPPTTSGRMVYVRNAADEGAAAAHEDLVAQLLQPPVAYRKRANLTFNKEQAGKIQVTRKGAKPVELAKQGLTWRMTQPTNAEADGDAVRNLLQDVSNLSAKKVASVGDKAKFGLTDPEVSLAVWVEPPPATQAASQPASQPAKAKPPVAATVTASQPASMPSKGDPKREIQVLKDLLEYQKTNPKENPLATQMLKDLLAQKQAAAGQPEEVAKAVTTTTGPADSQKQIEVLKQLLEYQKTNPKENPKATEMLKEMLAEKTGDRQTSQPAAKPATKPAATVHQILVSRKDGVTYAALTGGDVVYELDTKIFEDLTAELHDRQITRFTVEDVAELAFKTKAAQITLRKAGEEWQYVEDPVLPIDSKKVTDVCNAFRELRTRRYVDSAAGDPVKYGLAGNTDRLSITTKSGRKTEILLSADGPADDPDKSRYAMVAGTKQVFLLKQDQAAKFSQKIEDFEKKSGSSTENK